MNQFDYFEIFRSSIDLKDKHVLEVGGAVPVELVEKAGVSSWTALDVSQTRLSRSGFGKSETGAYRVLNLDIADLDCKEEYDVVYSTNCFEHVGRLALGLDKIYAALKPSGLLFTVFAPIWSSRYGHHAFVHWRGRNYTFNDRVVPDWYHLTHDENEMHEFLCRTHDSEFADEMCYCTYHGTDINHLNDSEYETLIARYDYSAIFKLRLRSFSRPSEETRMLAMRRHPSIRNLETLGYFWVLKKGRPTFKELSRFYVRGALQIGWRRFLKN